MKILHFVILLICVSATVIAHSLEDKTLGKSDAAVTIEMYADFHDPFSKQWFADTLPKIKENYINSGKAKLIVKHFPLQAIHPYSKDAAMAADCAADQGQFFGYVDILFENIGKGSSSDLISYAQQINLHGEEFSDCLNNKITAQDVELDLAIGNTLGIQGVPTFYINGVKLVGAQPYDVFAKAIDAAAHEDFSGACDDSDWGKNYYQKGVTAWKVDGSYNKQEDYCLDSQSVSEGYCIPDADENGKSYMRISYSCENGCKDGACAQKSAQKVSEKVACVFNGADKDNYPNCYSDSGSFNCESYAQEDGVLRCISTVSGYKGEKITWKSSCGGYGYTILDGDDETVKFSCQTVYENCPQGCTCHEGKVFECAIDKVPCPAGCSCDTTGVVLYCGKQVCIDSDNGKNYYQKGAVSVKIIKDIPETKKDICAAESVIPEKADYYKNLLHEAYCYNGHDYAYDDFECPNGCKDGACVPFVQEEDEIIPEKEDYSSQGCQEKKCKELSKNCVHDDQMVLEECTFYIRTKDGSCEEITNTRSRVLDGACDEQKQLVMFCQGCQLDESTCLPIGTRLEKKESAYYCDINKKMTVQKEIALACQNNYECETNICKSNVCKPLCEGCLDKENICLPIGTRTDVEYCDVDSALKSQRIETASCNNNFECGSNLCVDGQCIEKGAFTKIMDWFRKLF